MKKLITVGREFGSGGRELARRLAEELGIDYYDKEILDQIAQHTSLSEEYVRQVVEGQPHQLFPITIGHSMDFVSEFQIRQMQSIYKAQTEIITALAEKSDCVIVGRCADYILRDDNPFRIFVYADIDSRLKRCIERQPKDEPLSEGEIRKQIISIDKKRSRYYEDFTGLRWGDKSNYDLCINTTYSDVKKVAGYIAKMFV